MKKRRFLFLALAAALCVGLAAPASAVENIGWSGFYSLEGDFTWVNRDTDYYYILSETTTVHYDPGYYIIEGGTSFTLTNLRKKDGYVFVYYEAYPIQAESLVFWMDIDEDGQSDRVDFQGEHVCYNNGYQKQYYLNQNGEWELYEGTSNVFEVALDTPETYAADMSGMLLYSGESVTFTLPDDGTDTLYRLGVRYKDVTNGASYWKYTLFKNRNVPTVAGFSDVYGDDYYAEAVAWAKENDITGGTSSTTFSPYRSVTRAEAVTFLWRAAGEPDPVSMESPYIDVLDPDNYFYKAVLWAAEQGIAGGVGGGRFSLWGDVSYEQMLAMLCRTAGEDASGADWSAKALSWAEENGLTDGISFSALDDCPRCDVVYCLWKQMA